MKKDVGIIRIPLETRLNGAALHTNLNIRKLFFIRLDEYFKGFFSLSRDPCFKEYLKKIRTSGWADQPLGCYLSGKESEGFEDEDFYGDEGEYAVNGEKEREKYDAWYQVLIEPFVRLR
ncbi:MAG: hypothetical protein HFI93_05860 [Lachnospiraceae bacterium]|nr:hypothetical protein [Lachnospiraceae bacterium]